MKLNVDFIYPIGSLYLSINSSFNPNLAFGGTWEQITSDAYLKIVSTEDTCGILDGTSSQHKIPISSMPSHAHTINYGGNQPGVMGAVPGATTNYGPNNLFIQATGGSQPYYPYYLGVYVWKRTA